MRWLATTLAALITVGTAIAQPASDAPSITTADWQAYRTKFLDPSGRIIDDANGEISHSEGQGYGMLLAYLAGNRADFDLIWSFTRTELLLRDDGLATWRWDPKSAPHVTDINNATDGDILIAYALALGGDTWKAPELSRAASDLIGAIRKTTIVEHEGRSLLLPGVSGFSATDRPVDGPVVNLSYWVYEAFPTFDRIDPDPVWDAVYRDGLSLLKEVATGPRNLPPNWLSLRASPKPAEGFPPRFGYDSLRIPLYLARAETKDVELLKKLGKGMSSDDGVALVDLASDTVTETLTDHGYRIIPALANCVAEGTAVPSELRNFTPTLYYPSTLHLLALAYLADHPGACG